MLIFWVRYEESVLLRDTKVGTPHSLTRKFVTTLATIKYSSGDGSPVGLISQMEQVRFLTLLLTLQTSYLKYRVGQSRNRRVEWRHITLANHGLRPYEAPKPKVNNNEVAFGL